MRIEEKIINTLINTNQTLATAESCTGGLLSHRLTNISGSSKVFFLGLITYSNDYKKQLLNIPDNILKKHGAVSNQTATLMAQNVRDLAKTDFGIGISGIAGPTGGTKAKPVGTVFIAISTKFDEDICIECLFEGKRSSIKSQSATQALRLLREFL